jgi:hypothetical protein
MNLNRGLDARSADPVESSLPDITDLDAVVEAAESLYRAGRTQEVVASVDGVGPMPNDNRAIRLMVAKGMALFDLEAIS